MNSDAYIQGVTLAASGHQSEAVKVLKNVLGQQPENIDAWLTLEKCLQDPKEKQDCLYRILSLRPDNIVAKIRLAKLVNVPSSVPPVIAATSAQKKPGNLVQVNQPQNFSTEQHARQTQFCWNCGEENLLDFNYCSNCRSELGESRPQIPVLAEKKYVPPEIQSSSLPTKTIDGNIPAAVVSRPQEINIKSSTPEMESVTSTPTSTTPSNHDEQQNNHDIESETLFTSHEVTITKKQITLQRGDVVLLGDVSGFNGSINKISGGIIFFVFVMALISLIPALLFNEDGAIFFSLCGFSFFIICALAAMARNSKVQTDNIGLLTITTTDRRQFVIPNLSKIDDAVAAITRGKQMTAPTSISDSHLGQVEHSSLQQPDTMISVGENEKVAYNQNNIWISNTRMVSSKITLGKSDVLGFEWKTKTAWWVYFLMLLLSPIVITASMYGLTEAPILLIFGGLIAFNRLRWLYRWGTTYQLLLKTNQGLIEFCNAKDYFEYDALRYTLSNNF